MPIKQNSQQTTTKRGSGRKCICVQILWEAAIAITVITTPTRSCFLACMISDANSFFYIPFQSLKTSFFCKVSFSEWVCVTDWYKWVLWGKNKLLWLFISSWCESTRVKYGVSEVLFTVYTLITNFVNLWMKQADFFINKIWIQITL